MTIICSFIWSKYIMGQNIFSCCTTFFAVCACPHTEPHTCSRPPSCYVSLPSRLLIGCWSLAGFGPPRDYYCCCSHRGNTGNKSSAGWLPQRRIPEHNLLCKQATSCRLRGWDQQQGQKHVHLRTSKAPGHKTEQPGHVCLISGILAWSQCLN